MESVCRLEFLRKKGFKRYLDVAGSDTSVGTNMFLLLMEVAHDLVGSTQLFFLRVSFLSKENRVMFLNFIFKYPISNQQ